MSIIFFLLSRVFSLFQCIPGVAAVRNVVPAVCSTPGMSTPFVAFITMYSRVVSLCRSFVATDHITCVSYVHTGRCAEPARTRGVLDAACRRVEKTVNTAVNTRTHMMSHHSVRMSNNSNNNQTVLKCTDPKKWAVLRPTVMRKIWVLISGVSSDLRSPEIKSLGIFLALFWGVFSDLRSPGIRTI